ncbi:MAG: efflux RND transporter periplasmic adaptor subunit [Acidobacteriota bacterium]|nr:efflux RND transporter periplasmic adaptor subunit [Acidobacteriota bacterium]
MDVKVPGNKKKKKKKRMIRIGIPVLAAIGLLAFVLIRSGRTEIPEYNIDPLAKGPIEDTIAAAGTLNPIDTIEIGSQVSGKIVKLYADYNSQVKAGQVVAMLDQEILKSKVATAEANEGSSKAAVEEAQTALAVAKNKHDRNTALFAQNLLSFEDKESADSNYLSAQVTLKQASNTLSQAEASLRQARVDLSHAVITSPIDGTVLERSVNLGQTVAASMSTPVLFKVATDLTHLHLQCSIDEADIGSVKEGQEVRFTVDAVEDRTFSGTVKQVRYASVTTSNVVTYTTIIDADNSELLLRPGMTATVTVVTAQASDVFRVLNSALKYNPLTATADLTAQAHKLRSASRHTSALYVMDDLGQLRVVPVRIGIIGSSTTEVAGDQLVAGMKVVTGLKGATTTSATSNFDMPMGPPPGGGGPPPGR